MAMVFVNVCLALFFLANFACGIGVNWGQTTSHNLQPKITAQLLKDNGIDKVKLYGSDASMINIFAKTGISVIVGIPNEDLKKYNESYNEAKKWVQTSVEKHVKDKGVNITFVAVGNEPFLQSYNGLYMNTILPAIKNIQKALNEAGLGDKIKATTPINEEAYDLSVKAPSQCDFRKDIKDTMVELVRWFDTNNSPFLVNINPFRSYQDLSFPEDSLFFTPKAKPIITDKNASYNNIFDLSIDKLASSLESAAVPNLKIMVGEIGWPTDGGINANNTIAKKFYAGFLTKLASNEGSPLRPGSMEVYLSSLLDEDMRSIAQGNHERHWGIFRFDGQPKYPIDFSGQGRDMMPVAAKGVQYLPGIYCIFNKETQTNLSEIPANLDYACKVADCTALSNGSSCSSLDHDSSISYAFNMYFQMYNQLDNSCNFEGLATLSMTSSSTSRCFFPIQMMKSSGIRVAFGASQIVGGVLTMVLLALLSGGV